jgi:hypothetical protein
LAISISYRVDSDHVQFRSIASAPTDRNFVYWNHFENTLSIETIETHVLCQLDGGKTGLTIFMLVSLLCENQKAGLTIVGVINNY